MNMSGSDLKELGELGFKHVGDFFVNQGKVQFTLTGYRDKSRIYAFVIGEEVTYIGLTEATLYGRMNGYSNPGPTQETNKRINPKIAESGKVRIYFIPESYVAEFATIRRGNVERQIRPI